MRAATRQTRLVCGKKKPSPSLPRPLPELVALDRARSAGRRHLGRSSQGRASITSSSNLRSEGSGGMFAPLFADERSLSKRGGRWRMTNETKSATIFSVNRPPQKTAPRHERSGAPRWLVEQRRHDAPEFSTKTPPVLTGGSSLMPRDRQMSLICADQERELRKRSESARQTRLGPRRGHARTGIISSNSRRLSDVSGVSRSDTPIAYRCLIPRAPP